MSELFYRHRHLLQVGDQVRVRIDPVFPAYDGKERYPIGATGEIVGFAIKSNSRTNKYARGLQPGIYLDPEWPFVRFDAAVVRNIRANSLELVDEAEYNRRLEKALLQPYHTVSQYGTFVSNLPDMDIWEGDIVRLTKHRAVPEVKAKPGSIPGLPDAYMVCHVNYRDIAEGTPGITESLDNYPKFGIGDRFMQHWEGRLYDFYLELIERGNFWRRAHGEPLMFKDLEEEAFWAWLVDEVKAVPAPQKPRRSWEKDCLSEMSPKVQAEEKAKWWDEAAALACINSGKGHGLQTHRVSDPDGPGCYVWHNVLRFKDRDLGRRVAKATPKGFRIPSKDNDNDQE